MTYCIYHMYILLRFLFICGDRLVRSQYQISKIVSDIEPQSNYKMNSVSTFIKKIVIYKNITLFLVFESNAVRIMRREKTKF